ncbi:hypothetical protein [Streptomyces sp. NPDC093225]|uniref:hypothetical protein n=1 Tax=Streptomyces sp. NPDC093225 TaxID=3366034 RepID=UPI0037F22329
MRLKKAAAATVLTAVTVMPLALGLAGPAAADDPFDRGEQSDPFDRGERGDPDTGRDPFGPGNDRDPDSGRDPFDRGEQGDRNDWNDWNDQGDRGDRGDRGDQGDRGDRGDRGDQGDRNDRGDRGDRGDRDDRDNGRNDNLSPIASVSPSTAAPGQRVTLNVNGCGTRTGTASSSAFGTSRLSPGGRAADDLSGSATVFANLTPGSYPVTFQCDGLGGRRVTITLRVGPGAARGGLGGSIGEISPGQIAVGGALVAGALGAGFWYFRRRTGSRS